MNFYVTLPSNSSMELFPNNTLGNYTTQLKKTIKFDIPYEVALVEMIYNYKIQHFLGYISINENNILKNTPIFYKDGQEFSTFIESLDFQIREQLARIDYISNANEKKNAKDSSKTQIIDDENFTDDYPDDFEFKNKQYLTILKTSFRNNIPKFTLNGNKLSIKSNGMSITGYRLQEILEYYIEGFHSQDLTYTVELTKPIYLNSFYVYTDIIEHQIVGDVVVPLLANVALKGNYGDVVSASFNNPHYKPVSMSELYSINIEIKDDEGKKILFDDGKLITKLHFRPIKYGY